VQLFGLFVLFPMYILVKFHWGDTYRNLDANLHRIIMNPILLMLLIPAFYLQHQNSELGKS
jgi:integral membrane sensor domain MASE1